MPTFTKPKIGLLGLMAGSYEPIFPGIIARQEAYAREIAADAADAADIYFPGAATDRESIANIMREFNQMQLDGILIVLLTYSQGAWLVHPLQDNRLPVALAVVQPDHEVKDDWEELELTVNQGLHGAQDNANAIARLRIPCPIFAGDRKSAGFRAFVEDFAKAAQTRQHLRRMKVAVIGKMTGMNNILADEMAVLRKIGPEYCHETVGSIYSCMETVTKREIDESIQRDKRIFDIDPNLTYDSHAYATQMYLGIKKFLEDGGFDAFTLHFDFAANDLRIRQLPLMAASHLMADGYGYAAEGDSLCASMVSAAHCIGNADGNFTEMYSMDFEKQAIIFCHAGEANWATHRKDMKPRLIDRYLGEGGLENPPTPIFTPEVGPATLTSLTPLVGDEFRLLVCDGEMLPKSDLERCEMPYFFWRPNSGIERCIEGWARNGGTHHEVINIGSVAKRWKMLAGYLGVECVAI